TILGNIFAQTQQIISYPLPDTLSFAGEKVPLEDQDLRERLSREIDQNVYKQAATLLILKRANRWQTELSKILKAEGIHEDFFYLAIAESELDEYAVSAKEALGFWQFLAPTAKENGLEVSTYVDQRKDPIAATYAACKYLKVAYKKFGNWACAAASYNRGMAGFDKAVQGQKTSNYYEMYLNRETYRYIPRILALKVILENPEKYGFFLKKEQKYAPFDYREIVVNASISDLAAWAIEQGSNYKVLKIYNAWLDSSDYTFVVPKGKTYTFRLPK
ncbi:MAG: lytic transglycosylase domain-containing protein, partial [Bacteroidetes bacterium]